MKKNREKNRYVKAVKVTRAKQKQNQKRSLVFAPDSKGRFSRFLGKLAGIGCMGVGALTLIVLSIRSSHYGIGWSFTHYFYLFLCMAGMILFANSHKKEKQMARFRYYRSFMENKEYILLREIADITGRKISFLQKDLARMSREKLFLQANMNGEGTCLFLTTDAFKRYQRGQLILVADSKDEKSSEERNPEYKDQEFDQKQTFSDRRQDRVNTETEQSQSDAWMDRKTDQNSWEEQLHSINFMLGRIRNPEIIKPISDICIRGQQIIYFKDTNMGKEVERFLGYYLPVIQTVLTTYMELEKEELEEQASDLVVIINTIQHSFVLFVEKLIEGKRVDVEEDIGAVEMMLSNQYR